MRNEEESIASGQRMNNSTAVTTTAALNVTKRSVATTVVYSTAASVLSTSTPTWSNSAASRVADQPPDNSKLFRESLGNSPEYDSVMEKFTSPPIADIMTWTSTGSISMAQAAYRPSIANAALHGRMSEPYNTSFMRESINKPYTYAAPISVAQLSQPQQVDAQVAQSFRSNLSSSHIAARHVLSRDLPIFTGKPEEWLLFISNYEQSTERCGFSDEENLIRLQKCIKGPALEAVRGKLMIPATVPYAIGTLRMLYGRPEMVHGALRRKIIMEPAIRPNNLDSIIRLALAVQNYCATLTAVGLGEYLNDPVLLGELVAKMPSDLKLDWGRQRLAMSTATLTMFDNWLFGIAMCATQATPYEAAYTGAEERRSTTKERVLVHSEVASPMNGQNDVQPRSQNRELCPKCNGDHRLTECLEFRTLSCDARWRFVKTERLCFCCFLKHTIRRCKTRRRCGIDGCNSTHNVLLHSPANRYGDADRSTQETEASRTTRVNESPIMFHGKTATQALFRYVPIVLYGEARQVHTYAMVDEGAACTLMENSLADELELTGPEDQLCLRWTNDIIQTVPLSKTVRVKVSGDNRDLEQYEMKGVRTVNTLDLPIQTLNQNLLQKHGHLRQISIAPYTAVRPRIIIGLDNLKLSAPLEVREAEGDGVIAARCRLGWSVYGRQRPDGIQMTRLLHICECNDPMSLRQIDSAMKNYYSVESLGVSRTREPLRSKEDERSLQIMKSTTTYLAKEKRWETGLLWKFDQVNLPNSFPMALKRLKCLETKMEKDAHLRSYLMETMRNHEQKGYIRKLGQGEMQSGPKSWVLPIFTVTNPNKKKTRMVWDAAAKVDGVSLNDTLLKGPDVLASLFGVLIRFRERPIAIAGDIREMFHQVRLRREDQPAQKFLWRGGDSSREPDTYVMQVLTFGASCSPALANYIKNRNAQRFIKDQPAAAKAILENTFVDDWLQSADTVEEMINLSVAVKAIHADGGFEMRNWISNCAQVLRALDDKPTSRDLQLCPPEAQEKVLGMWWLPEKDSFTYRVKPELMERAMAPYPTKRRVLSVIMSLFDPLGLLGFFSVRGKIILQNIWRSGTDWDARLAPDDEADWCRWLKELPKIGNLTIPRCMSLASVAKNLQLHIFVDASAAAYAATVFLRAELNGEVRCSLIAAKTRVAPVKPISIPRMELMAAILGLRLVNTIEGEIRFDVHQRFFWTDSRDVLCWIQSDARKFTQFVALRIGEILEGSDVKSWRWVPSAANVADDGTKWTKTPEISGSVRWFVGPKFLYEDEQQWPKQNSTTRPAHPNLISHICEEQSTKSALSCIIPDPQRFSKLENLRAAQRCVLDFLRIIVKQQRGEQLELILQLKRNDEADTVFIRACQEGAFPNEIKRLSAGFQVTDRKSALYKCSPYLDEAKLLRVRGRIDAIDGISIETKRPIILPRQHRVTFLIADYFHRCYHHLHNEIVINEMRQQYWVSGLRALVREVAKNCPKCRIRRANPEPPEMSGLPVERLSPYTLPFTYTGVDYFGPIDVAVGRRREKRWGVLFTCLTTRAVHLELATTLSTDSFLCILKTFTARRGVPRRLFSDNGTNFRGANRLLTEEIQRLSSSAVEQKYPTLQFIFNPPGAPHMGGAWERLVRSTKAILMEILPTQVLRDEVLRAALADVEHTLNSRPLTYLPLDAAESEALTPNHFLVGSSSGLRLHGSPENHGTTLSKNFRIAGQIADRFWKRWTREYLPTLTRRTKWFQPPTQPLAKDDVVIIVDENNKRNTWTKGVVLDVHRGKDGQVRSAVVRTADGITTRPAVKLAKLDIRK